MCCDIYLIMTFPVGLPAKIGNPVLASQIRFQLFRAIERFFRRRHQQAQWFVGHSSDDLEFLLTVGYF